MFSRPLQSGHHCRAEGHFRRKSSEHVVPADRKQLMNYLRATDIEVALLLHFGPRAQFHRLAYSNSAKPARKTKLVSVCLGVLRVRPR
ncbi:MAG: GxxExxY protein [Gemmatimonadaceae bacterium]